MNMQKKVIHFFVIIVMISSVSAFAPTHQEDFSKSILPWNTFPEFPHGIPDSEKTATLPVEWNVISAYWNDGDLVRVLFNEFDLSQLGITVADKSSLEEATRIFLESYGSHFGADSLRLQPVFVDFPGERSSPPYSSSMQNVYPAQHVGTVIYEQVLERDGVLYPVLGSFFVFGIKEEQGRLKLAFTKSNLYEDDLAKYLAAEEILPEDEVVLGVQSTLGSSLGSAFLLLEKERMQLVGYPVSVEDRSGIIYAYEIVFKTSLSSSGHLERLRVIADALSGNILNIENTLKYDSLSGKVEGSVYPEVPTKDPLHTRFKQDYAWILESSGEEKQGVTGTDGTYAIEAAAPKRLRSQLQGPWVKVMKASNGESMQMDRPVTKGYDIDWTKYDKSYKDEQSNVFYHVNVMHEFATQDHLNVKMNFQMPSYVQQDDICNAYFDSEDRSLNFFKKGKAGGYTCEATSLFSGVIYHEYGHAISNELIQIFWPYRDETGNMDEAFSDYVTCSVRDTQGFADPACMQDFEIGNEIYCFRRCDSGDRYPENYDPEPHSGMQIISGALWDIREKLIAKKGKEEGAKYADSLIFGALRYQPISFVDLLDSTIISDDDNGNPTDGTPNVEEICASFLDHGITSDLCLGGVNQPIANILIPEDERDYYWFLSSGYVPVIGTAFVIDPFFSEGVLTLGKFDHQSKTSQKTELARFSSPVKSNYLYNLKELEPGDYFLNLKVSDKLGRVAQDTDYITLRARAHISLVNDLSNKKISDMQIIYRSYGFGSEEIGGASWYCKDSSCDRNVLLPAKPGDLIVYATERGKIGNEYLFYRRIEDPSSVQNIELRTSQMRKFSTNIEQIMEQRKMKVKEVQNAITLSRTMAFYTLSKWGRSTFVSADDNLPDKSYLFVKSFNAARTRDKTFMKLNAIFAYPFSEDFMVDESQLQNSEFQIYNTLKYKEYLGHVKDYTRSKIDPIDKGNFYTLISQPSRDSSAEPFLGISGWGKRTGYAVSGGVVYSIQENIEERRSLSQSPEKKEFFKDPYHFEIELLNSRGFPKMLYGFLVDGAGNKPTGFLIPSSKLTLTVKSPDGSVTDRSGLIDNFNEENFLLDNIQWVLDCQEVTCPVGEYAVDWASSSIFQDKKVIMFHGEYSFDGAQFTKLGEERAERALTPEDGIDTDEDTSYAEFTRGDINDDGKVDISDSISLLGWLFLGKKGPYCDDIADVNDNGIIDMSDAIFIMNYLFRGGETISAPYPNAGEDPTKDYFICR